VDSFSLGGRQLQIPAGAWMSRETIAAARYERLGQGIVYKARSSFQYSASVAYAASRHA
jgi:hypothetical protein